METTRALFAEAGCLHFRGFEVGEERFRRFTEKFARRFVLDPGGSKGVDTQPFRLDAAFLQPIVPGGNEQDLHQENGRWSDIPDILWFYCVQPARQGGETKVADGVRLWNELAPSTRDFFLRHKVKYVTELPSEMWRQALKLFFLTSIDSVNLRGTTMRFLDVPEEPLRLEYTASAVRKPRFAPDLPAFCNSLLGPYTGPVTLESDAALPGEVMEDVARAHRAAVERVSLSANDVLMIDNTRFLHGRTAFTDSQRNILSAMAVANF